MALSAKSNQMNHGISRPALVAGLVVITGTIGAVAQDKPSQADWAAFYGERPAAQTAATAQPASQTTNGQVSASDMEAFLNGTLANTSPADAQAKYGRIVTQHGRVNELPASSLSIAGMTACDLTLEQDGAAGLNSNIESDQCQMMADAEDTTTTDRAPRDPVDSSVAPSPAPTGLTGTPLDLVLNPIAEAAGIEGDPENPTGTPLDTILAPVLGALAGAAGDDAGGNEGPTGTPLDTVLGPVVDAIAGDEGGGDDGPTGTPLDTVLGPVVDAIAGDDTPPPGGGERTIVGTLDDTTDFAGAGDTNGDNTNDTTDLQNNLTLALTVLAAELTNPNTETHVVAQTLADLQGGGDDLQQDLQDLLVGGGADNSLQENVTNILTSLTPADGGGDPGPTGTPLDVVLGPVVDAVAGDDNPPPPGGERTIVGSVDDFTDFAGAGDSNGDNSTDTTDLQNNLTLGLTVLVAELTNPNPETHVVAQTLADLQGGGDDLQQDLQDLLVGGGADNSLQENVTNILASLAPADGGGNPGPTGTPLDVVIGPIADVITGNGNPPPPGGERTIVGSVDDFTDFAGAGDSNGDNVNNQDDIQNNLTLAVTVLAAELTNPNTDTHVLAQTLADLQGGGDDLQQDIQDLLLDNGADNGLGTNVTNILTGLTTPGTGGGLPLDTILGQLPL